MAILLPVAFQPIGAWGTAQIAPRKILGADEWTDIVANDAYLRSSLCRRRSIGFATQSSPIELERLSTSITRYFELYKGRFKLSPGRTAAFLDYDISSTVLRVRHLHVNEFQGINSLTSGAAYTPGDILTVVGGTGTAATIQVNTVTAGPPGPIAVATLATPGDYTAFPRSAVVNHGPETIVDRGVDYTVADVLTVVGGTGTAATLTVGSVTPGPNPGRITSLSAHTGGDYTLSPFDIVFVTGGSGSGARFQLDFGDGGTRTCTVTGGTGSGATFNLSRDIVSVGLVPSAGRSQGTLPFTSISVTEYDLLIEARNFAVPPAVAEFFALRYREKAILLADL